MNRLILIGNGFDLAHGLETSFKDFILSYLCDCVKSFENSASYNDGLIEFKVKFSSILFRSSHGVKVESVLSIIDFLIKAEEYNVVFKSSFLERIYHKINDLSWVDLELEFFETLIENRNDKYNWQDSVKSINNDLDFLKVKLIEYLKKACKGNSIQPSFELAQCFTSNIQANEVRAVSLKQDILPENLYFLNFNYTDTLSHYLRPLSIPFKVNYIHGDLNEEYAKPIFGFGDELDKDYLEFEDHKNNELFKHIKSFQYLLSTNYFDLTRFIESEDFQVHIYGHSCGLSDRTMLNQIFEHDNCKSIKIYFHEIDSNINDFVEKTYDIARHFKDKVMFRKKLVPLPLSKPMPQPKLSHNPI
ncbi:AbiH family protein [uncultured Algoriphagus sp.]|uniref:AbiH family protein n=1 Tax=uncultured Algoriphagus sp. TaxID=417365 RepID=UPI0030EBCB83|tara:strand:- start:3534 stop:4613 length:1080 start_codon:yes stop_codon:yes gene_type:complete